MVVELDVDPAELDPPELDPPELERRAVEVREGVLYVAPPDVPAGATTVGVVPAARSAAEIESSVA